MQIKTHPLISPTLGTERHLTSFHYGPTGGQKIYIQASLHADELPGMLVAWRLRKHFASLEAAGKLRGEVIVVPVANPIGLNQRVLGSHIGRFEGNTAQNFNRNFYDLTTLVMHRVEARLTRNIDENRQVVRTAMREALDEQTPLTELDSQRLALQKLSCDADVVIDLHCDWEAAMHLYTNPDIWGEVEPLARYIGAKASLLALNADGNPFDEIHSFCWSNLRARYGKQHPIPNGGVSVTVELRGQRDVSHEFAEQDAQAIVNYLCHRDFIDAEAAPLPALPFPATPFAGAAAVITPVSGVLAFRAELGAWIESGQPVVDIIDPLTDHVSTLNATTSGVLYAHRSVRFASAGMSVAHIAGATAFRTGSLLPL
ncbi:Succinylglutamate desuccinylase/aspartoacylase [Paraburkholderia ribeironis]|uniref:Succinylglutamate desuccinylase/aspartoacylase n=1 Tax=Paraburkholderia ribeironis TaxID=1247936 RepID=A0A1N7SCY0_9BURK|nr:succinylglutamate desuccinylase/aspartoacylase family protein [Paraburkholderia ribeironis]SIT45267.1 Succinylglutamate desuccinylase/aspartoacylase [Paraburkholderia ribeironis]